MYIDLHAHAQKKSTFIYGNSIEYKNQVFRILITLHI